MASPPCGQGAPPCCSKHMKKTLAPCPAGATGIPVPPGTLPPFGDLCGEDKVDDRLAACALKTNQSLWNTIPFIGPSLASNPPFEVGAPDPKKCPTAIIDKAITDFQGTLQGEIDDWRRLQNQFDGEVAEMLDDFFGDFHKDVEAIVDDKILGLTFRQGVLGINVVCLGVVVLFIVMYYR